MATGSGRRRLTVFAAVVAAYAAGTAIAVRLGYSFGPNTLVRCRRGHLYCTFWVPGASVKSARLGFWRVQWCPVGRHVDLVHPVKADALTEEERWQALADHDIRVP